MNITKMTKSNSTVDEKWIHSFAVTDVFLHPKKFTVYKITSVVFPIEIPEALTCLTVWKRFNDIKALLKFVKKRHKIERLNGMVPTLDNHTFFKRFEADVITERKLFIIRLLDFVGQHPALYKSQVFQEFFATTQTMPNDESLQFEADDIPVSKDTVDCAAVKVINSMVDPDETPIASTSSSMDESFESSSVSTPIIDSPADGNSDDGYKASSENDIIISDSIKIKSNSTEQTAAILTRQYSRQYSRDPIETPCHPNERKELSKFKVLKVVDRAMQVQDLTTKHIYIMKSIDKVFNEPEEFYLPTNFPFMVSLVAYYVSESSVYLLLEQATGGQLYDYIYNYNRHSLSTKTTLNKSVPIKFKAVKSILKSNPIEIPDTLVSHLKTSDAKSSEDEENFSFYDLLQSYYDDVPLSNSVKPIPLECEESFDEAPHFNLIANDLDVNNILNCSQKLLKSVSTTLKRVQTTTESNLLCNDIITKTSDSVESLDQSNEDKDDIYLNIISPSPSEPFNAKESIINHNYYESFKLFDVSQLPRAIIKRWFREIIFAVKHLHANDIACYDLQPHNLLLGKNGEILLSYFYRREFTPYIFGDEMHQTCYPIVYIAPERPLTLQSDVWSMGVIFYELLTGFSFQSCHPDGILSYFDIQYPENFELDSTSKDLIEGMLQIDPVQRTKLDEIEENPFFISIWFNELSQSS
ncbi:ribosomal protein S6 kinase delta-1 isoform X2 [Sitodiplosis mosellana]|uniref:ribosomal protein S6 kinase delta-1 isoform X2 n=1 Tax=Sitodiplosis mosellana TaxID=263140 RepID=UPI00244515A4|nr:ribosomal protein S6 kinase delta-1 isoform X2 [Sitodiplosis mosellana]